MRLDGRRSREKGSQKRPESDETTVGLTTEGRRGDGVVERGH